MSEANEAKRMGASLHKNSGRGTKKGDATWKDYVVDYKEFSKSFSLSKDVWAKVVTDALKADKSKSPLIVLVLGEGANKIRLAIHELADLEMLVEEDDDSV